MIQDKYAEHITALTEGLLYMSESERPFELICLGNITEEQLYRWLSGKISPVSLPYHKKDFDLFFQKAINNVEVADEPMMVYADRMQQLYNYLQTNATQTELVTAGTPEVHIYIICFINDAYYILHTVAIET